MTAIRNRRFGRGDGRIHNGGVVWQYPVRWKRIVRVDTLYGNIILKYELMEFFPNRGAMVEFGRQCQLAVGVAETSRASDMYTVVRNVRGIESIGIAHPAYLGAETSWGPMYYA